MAGPDSVRLRHDVARGGAGNFPGESMRHVLGGAVAITALLSAAQARAADGQEVYAKNCAVCHNSLKPKLGDKAAWDPVIKTGEDALVATVIVGKGKMPPRAGKPMLSDADIRAAVAFIESKAR
jgi:cytochrome c5